MNQHIVRRFKFAIRVGIACFSLCTGAVVSAADRGPLVIEEQGSLAAGGADYPVQSTRLPPPCFFLAPLQRRLSARNDGAG